MDNRVAGLPNDDLVGLPELRADAWAARWTILTITLVLALAGALAGSFLPKQYRAEILVTPADSPGGSMGGLGGVASQYGALASLAGVSLSGKGSKEEAIAVLQSELITEAYVHEANLLPVLYAKRWDAGAGRWKTDASGAIPTLWMANLYFKKHVRDVKEDKQTGLVTMRITWTDPVAAARWANDLVRVTNQYMRDKAIKEAEKNIDYLTDQAAKTSAVEARAAIFSIMKEEMNKQMIARGRDEYALKVLDPAQPPEIPSSPSAMLLGAAGAGLGLLLSALLVWRKSAAR